MSKTKPSQQTFFARNQNLIFYSVLATCIFWLFRKYLFFSQVYIFEDIGSDTLSLFYPNLLEYVRTFREEGMPLWSFSRGIGQSSYSKNLFNPFTWIYLIVGVKHLAFAIVWVQVLKLGLTIFCAHHLFRLQGLTNTAVLLGTTLVAFSGYLIVGSSWYGHSNNIMFMIMLLLALELLFVKNQWWLIPIPVVFLVGPPLLFVIEFAVLYTILRFALMGRLSWNSVLSFAKKIWIPISLGLMFIAPFIGGTIYNFIYSPRVGGGMSYVESLSSRNPFDLISARELSTMVYRFFSNDMLGTASTFTGSRNYLEAPLFYCGLLTLLIVPQLFIFLKRKQKFVIGLICTFWILLLSFPYLRYAFYFFVGDYYKSAISLFVPLTCIIMGITAFHFIIKEKRVNILLLFATLVVLLSILFFIPVQNRGLQVDIVLRNVVAFALVLYALLFSGLHFRKKMDFTYIIIGVIMLEGVFMAYQSTHDRQGIEASRISSRELYNDDTKEALTYLKNSDPGFYRIEKKFHSVMGGLNDGQAQGFFGTRSYRSHNHNNYIKFLDPFEVFQLDNETNTRWLTGFPHVYQLHPLFSIKYLLSNQQNKSEISKFYYEDIGELNGLELFKSKYYIPFGIPISSFSTNSDFSTLDTDFKRFQLLYSSVILDDNQEGDFPSLKRLDMQRITGALALENYRNDFAEKAMKITSFNQKRIEGTISLEKDAMVFYSMPFDKGWRAYANKQKVPLEEINNGLTGLFLEKGNYNIVLKYRPPFFNMGWFIFGIGFITYVILLLRRKKLGLNTLQDSLLPSLLE